MARPCRRPHPPSSLRTRLAGWRALASACLSRREAALDRSDCRELCGRAAAWPAPFAFLSTFALAATSAHVDDSRHAFLQQLTPKVLIAADAVLGMSGGARGAPLAACTDATRGCAAALSGPRWMGGCRAARHRDGERETSSLSLLLCPYPDLRRQRACDTLPLALSVL